MTILYFYSSFFHPFDSLIFIVSCLLNFDTNPLAKHTQRWVLFLYCDANPQNQGAFL